MKKRMASMANVGVALFFLSWAMWLGGSNAQTLHILDYSLRKIALPGFKPSQHWMRDTRRWMLEPVYSSPNTLTGFWMPVLGRGNVCLSVRSQSTQGTFIPLGTCGCSCSSFSFSPTPFFLSFAASFRVPLLLPASVSSFSSSSPFRLLLIFPHLQPHSFFFLHSFINSIVLISSRHEDPSPRARATETRNRHQ